MEYDPMKLVFATNNQHKVDEIQPLLGVHINLLSLADINHFEDIPEEQDTLEGNAYQKAHFIYHHYGLNCFADDTGLEVEALGGAPGVFSARYAGNSKNSRHNIEKLLREMEGMNHRTARFRTVISLIIGGEETRFEGIVNGSIIHEPKGDLGFGYDPIFQPSGHSITFAEMPLQEKNLISHRSRAIQQLIDFLRKQTS